MPSWDVTRESSRMSEVVAKLFALLGRVLMTCHGSLPVQTPSGLLTICAPRIAYSGQILAALVNSISTGERTKRKAIELLLCGSMERALPVSCT